MAIAVAVTQPLLVLAQVSPVQHSVPSLPRLAGTSPTKWQLESLRKDLSGYAEHFKRSSAEGADLVARLSRVLKLTGLADLKDLKAKRALLASYTSAWRMAEGRSNTAQDPSFDGRLPPKPDLAPLRMRGSVPDGSTQELDTSEYDAADAYTVETIAALEAFENDMYSLASDAQNMTATAVANCPRSGPTDQFLCESLLETLYNDAIAGAAWAYGQRANLIPALAYARSHVSLLLGQLAIGAITLTEAISALSGLTTTILAASQLGTVGMIVVGGAVGYLVYEVIKCVMERESDALAGGRTL